jgi:hypothetical protein
MRFLGTRLEKVMLCNRKVQLLNFAKQEGWDVSQYSIEITYKDLKASLMRTYQSITHLIINSVITNGLIIWD